MEPAARAPLHSRSLWSLLPEPLYTAGLCGACCQSPFTQPVFVEPAARAPLHSRSLWSLLPEPLYTAGLCVFVEPAARATGLCGACCQSHRSLWSLLPEPPVFVEPAARAGLHSRHSVGLSDRNLTTPQTANL